MIVWLIPGWEEAHDTALLATYCKIPAVLIEENAQKIRELYSTTKDIGSNPGKEIGMQFSGTGCEGYEIIVNKVERYSPTFLEELKLVKRTMFDVELVTNKCPIHGISERIARLFEIESPKFNIINNQEIHQRLVRPITSPGSRADLEEKVFASLYFSTSLRLNEIFDLKLGQIDLQHKRIKT